MPLAARNPEIQTLRRLLRRRSARSEAGRYVIEGPRLVLDALRAGVDVDAVYVPVDADGSDVDELVEQCAAAHVPLHRLAPGVLEQVASTQAPQPALAVARIVEPDLDEVLSHADNPLLLVLCDVSDPGNAGTLVRVAEATGATAVVVCGPAAVDVHNPKVVRSTAGSLFRVPVVSIAEAGDALDAMAAHKLTRLATVVDDGEQYDARDWRGPVAIVLGSEAHGLPDDVVASLDGAVAIPMLGGVESLNVAVAGAVLAFEAARQRRAAP